MKRYPPPRETDVRALAKLEAPVLSLLVPVTASVPDVAQNRVRHARVVASALARWRELGADAAAADVAERALADFAGETAAPAPAVATRAAFWSAQDGVRVFGLPHRHPETARVGTCAVVRPIALAAQQPDRYRVLVLSANRVALFEGDRDGLARRTTRELPESLEDALGSDLTEETLQLHSTGAGGTRPAYHGQGGAPRGRRVDLERFHQRVARGLEAELLDDAVPLVLAADARHRSGLERALKRDVGLTPKPLEGSADHLEPAALHRAAWPLAVEAASRPQPTPAQATGPPPVTHLSEIASNAVMGRIRRLRVPAAGEIPARLDRARASAAPAWGDDDLIESLAVQVLRRGGSVEVIEGERFPASNGSLAAWLW